MFVKRPTSPNAEYFEITDYLERKFPFQSDLSHDVHYYSNVAKYIAILLLNIDETPSLPTQVLRR